MEPILQSYLTEIDAETGFRYRAVCLNDENVILHYHDYYEIFLTLSDGIIHNINNECHHLDYGTLILIRKQDIHLYERESKEQVSFLNFAFTEEILDSLFDFLSDGFCFNTLLNSKMPPSVNLTNKDIVYIKSMFDQLNAFPPKDILSIKYFSRLIIFKIFTKYFSAFRQFEKLNTNSIPLWLISLDEKMHKLENFKQGADYMVELSGKCHAYLGRIVKKYYNQTITDYINDIRLQYLANSLITTDTPIIDLCYDCGFNNISWAYTLFKKKYNVSPSVYKNINK